jgi:S-methylmethionine-dependent homocysteine/selenocysteine methylase
VTERVLLLAGSVGPERVPSRPDPEQADWYLPLHLRDEHAARERIAGQVTAGADVVVAPTWLTHRRALLPLGETRRAGAWTAAAVRTAREAVEIGLERRQEALAGVPDDDVRRGRRATLVAASLPALDDAPASESGRLLPREAATARDDRDQAGAIADAEPDLILVEGHVDEDAARSAVTEASDTGLPVWAALTARALAASDLEAWLEWAQTLNVQRLLLPGPLSQRAAAAEGGVAFGAVAPSSEPIGAWLNAGASAVARLDGATSTALEPLRTAIDDHERAGIEAATIARARWGRHIADAAALAGGGAAAWVGATPATPLPPGFEWLVVAPDDAYRLPDRHYRLVVLVAGVRLDPARILQRGGIAAVADTGVVARSPELRLVAVEDSSLPVLAIARRER